MKPSEKPKKIPQKLWDAKMQLEYYSDDGFNTRNAVELILEYLIIVSTKE